MSLHQPAPIPSGRKIVDGKEMINDSRGGMIPVELAKPQDLLMDETVRKIIGYAAALSDQITRFKGHTFEDLAALDALLEQEYGVTVGGAKGNKTFTSHDALFKVEVRINDQFVFGPELQAAKALVDECLNEWAAEARPELQAIVTRAFNTEKAGQINRGDIFMLLRLPIEDARWQRAMDAIRDAIRVVGSKTYLRLQRRETVNGPWQTITIDLAKA